MLLKPVTPLGNGKLPKRVLIHAAGPGFALAPVFQPQNNAQAPPLRLVTALEIGFLVQLAITSVQVEIAQGFAFQELINVLA
jgi:hypothetical protein